jgi:hypothetical protein
MTPEIRKALNAFLTFRQGLPQELRGHHHVNKLMESVLRLRGMARQLTTMADELQAQVEPFLVTEILKMYADEDKGGRLAMFFACRTIRDKLLGPGCPRTMSHDDDAFHTVVGEQFEGKGTLRVEYLYELYRAVSNGKEAGQYG